MAESSAESLLALLIGGIVRPDENQLRTRLRRSNTDRIFLPKTKMSDACAKVLPGTHPSDVVSYLRLGEGMTVEQVANKLGVSMVTVRRWTPPDLVGFKHFTEVARESTKKGLEAMWAAQQRIKKERGYLYDGYYHRKPILRKDQKNETDN